MTRTKPTFFKTNGRLVFFQEFMKHPLQIGSVIPSSRFLEQRIVRAANVASARVIIELGPGTGGVTRAMLQAMPRDATLLSIEINPTLHSIVDAIDDQRFIAHLGSASELEQILERYGLDAPDAIVSGIPFSTMSHGIGSQIVAAVSAVLPANGRFVAYQVKRQVATLCDPVMGAGQTSLELLNIPPMRIFQWVKNEEEMPRRKKSPFP